MKAFWYAIRYGELHWAWNNPWQWGWQYAYYDGYHYCLHLGPISVQLYY